MRAAQGSGLRCIAAAGLLVAGAVGLLALVGLAGLAGLAGCKRSGTTPLGTPPSLKLGPPVTLPDGGMSHTEPLAEVRWAGGWVMACGERRVEGAGGREARSARGRCVVAGEAGAAAAPATGDGGTGEVRPADQAFRAGVEGAIAAPCRVHYEDIPGDPGAGPARASVIGPAGRVVVDEWRVPPQVDGDYFAVEVRVSPDGKRMAVLRVSVGIGDGERLVRVESAVVRPLWECR